MHFFYVSCIYEECDHCIHCMKRNMRGVFCSLYRHKARMNHQSTVILSFLSHVVLYILFVKINDVRKYNIPTACDHRRQLTTICLRSLPTAYYQLLAITGDSLLPTACDHWRQLTTNCLLPFVFMNGSVWCKDDQNVCHVKDIRS